MEEALRMFYFAFVLVFIVSCVNTAETSTFGYEVDEPSTVADNPSSKEIFSDYLTVWRFVTEEMKTALQVIGLDELCDEIEKVDRAITVPSLVAGVIMGIASLTILLCCCGNKSASHAVSHFDLIRNLEARIKILEDECQEKVTESIALQAELNEAKRKQHVSDEAASTAHQNLQNLMKKVHRCEDQKTQLSAAIVELTAEMERLNKRLNNTDEEDSDSPFADELIQAFKENNRDRAALDKEIISLQEQLKEKDNKIAEMQRKLEGWNTKKQSSENAARRESKTQLKDDEEKVSFAEKELERSRKQYDELKNTLNKLQEDFISQLAVVEHNCHDNWLKFRSKDRELDEVKRERDWLKRRLQVERPHPFQCTSPPTGNHIPDQMRPMAPMKDRPRVPPPGSIPYGPFALPPGLPGPRGPAAKIPDSNRPQSRHGSPIPGCVPPPPVPALAPFPQIPDGGRLPSKHDGPVPGFVPPPPVPALAPFPQIPDGGRLPYKQDGAVPPPREPMIPFIQIPDGDVQVPRPIPPPPPPPPTASIPRLASYGTRGPFPQAMVPHQMGPPMGSRPGMVPPPRSPPLGSPSGPPTDGQNSFWRTDSVDRGSQLLRIDDSEV